MGNKHDGRLSQGPRTGGMSEGVCNGHADKDKYGEHLKKGGCIGGMNEVVCAMGVLMKASTGSINERWLYWEYECVYDGRGL